MPAIFCTVLFVTFLLPLSTAAAQGGARETQRDKKEEDFWTKFEREVDNFVRRMTRDFSPYDDELKEAAGDTSRFRIILLNADTTIAAGDTLRGNVSFWNGNVTVRGFVDGNLQVHDGNLYLKDRARINGNVRMYNGRVLPEERASIAGSIDEQTTSGAEPPMYDIPSERWTGTVMRTRVPWQSEQTIPDNLIFRYNRVEGIFLGIGSEKRLHWDGRRNFSAYGSVGYGFSAHHWRGNLGVTRQFALSPQHRNQILEVGLEGYSLTDSKDQWRISRGENTAAAFFIHEDFRDYFAREGGSAFLGYSLKTDPLFAEGRIAFVADRYKSLEGKTDWALFGGSKTFRGNPPVDEGKMRSIQITAGITNATRLRYGPEGWTAYMTAEIADRDGIGGDFTFHQYLADIRRYQPLGMFDNLNIRLRIGSVTGAAPRQKLFELGGLGSIPAFRFKELPSDSLGGNRMILFNAEYVVNGNFLGDLDFWPSWLLRHIDLIFMADAGLVRSVAADEPAFQGFGGIRWKEFRSDLGVALANRSGSFRIGMIWRTDRAETAHFVLRFSRPF